MSSCWTYSGHLDAKGYGKAKVGGKVVRVHRAAYEAMVGPIPDGLQIDHLCRNRACYNPSHMEVVTTQENTRRGLYGINHRSKTHCPHGHEYDGYSHGQRYCRSCKATASRRKRTLARSQKELI